MIGGLAGRYPSDVSETARPGPILVPAPRPPGRAPVIFAVLGVLVALAAGGVYVYRQQAETPAAQTPEETVSTFLSAVFLSADPQKAALVVCSNWDPAEAISRTTEAVPAGARISWGDLRVVTTSEGRATVRGSLGMRLPDDTRPTSFVQWRFSLVDENGWRVCEARPLAT